MADDFKALIAAQKETTRLLMTAEERAVADKAKEEGNLARSASARKGWETRQENLSLQNQDYNKEASENLDAIDKNDDKSGAADEEDATKEEGKDNKILGYLKQTAGFLGGIAKQGMEKVKSGLSGFSKFLFGALAVAALAFLDHPKFKEMISLLVDTLIPLAVTFYEKVLVPVGAALAKLFKDIMGYLKDGKPSLMSILMDNKLAILGIVTALAPGLMFGALKLAVMGIGKAVVFLVSKLSFGAIFAKIGVAFAAIKTFFVGLVSKLSFGAIFAKIGIAFAAIKSFFVATLMPFLAAFAIPIGIIVGVVAGIILAIYSLKKGFDDFMFELEATGSIWEATKTGIVSVISNILGLPFDLLKDGVSWIIGKIGSVFGLESFTNASKVLDDFSIVDMMKDMLTFLGDSISGIFDGFMQAIQDFLRSGLLGKFGGSKVADKLFGTVEKQATEKFIEEAQQKRMVEDRKALREKQKLEKEIEEAKKLEKIKAEQNALQPKAPANLNLKVSSSRADPRGRMNPMDRADLDDAMPMAILNSGNTVTNNETIAPTLVKEINMTDSDPFIKSFANAKDFSFG